MTKGLYHKIPCLSTANIQYIAFILGATQNLVFFMQSASALYKQPHRTHTLIAGGGDVPAIRAGLIPIDLQRDIMPPIREQGRKAASGMDAVSIQEQTGVWVVVIRGGEFELVELFLFHVWPSFLL